MHIPDGYLSPSTCAGLYAAAAPFWYVALRRVRRVLTTRAVPLLSVFSAFSFVVMMFNLPLPGGTTGHAVGMTMASIVLGPWIALLAISTALLIQALLFGDGGITAYGANCFNMAIVGSLIAYGVYRLIARGAALTASRRVVAAGVAGYCAINFAALCAAIEFGIQPIFFHDAAGTPLYAPYPLHIAIPAMMLGHLTFAGLAEMVLAAALVAYLQKAEPALLRRTAPEAPELDLSHDVPASTHRPWPSARKLWLLLGVFLILTPLGILAAGSAWGEWQATDFEDKAARAEIAAASRNYAPPAAAPKGLASLSKIWSAPVSGYAPEFIRSPGFGYFVAGGVGVGTIILLTLLAGLVSGNFLSSRVKSSFLEKTVASFHSFSERTLLAEETADRSGPLQRMDPRVKVAGFAAWILAAVALHKLEFSVALLTASILLALWTCSAARAAFVRVWLGVLAFTGSVALPALFLTPGEQITSLPLVDWSISGPGFTAAAFLILRAETTATLLLILVLTTPWQRLLRAFRLFRVPVTVVAILEMTYRYVFVFLRMAQNMFEARRARLLAPLDEETQRTSAAAISAALLGRTFSLSSEVHSAMQARGFRGDIRLLDDLAMRRADWLQLAAMFTLAVLAVVVGR
jgi:cobalt/nickel transport system permease protein